MKELHTKIPAFSVQFHPEACSGPLDTSFLFDEFVRLINDHAIIARHSRPSMKELIQLHIFPAQ